MAEEKFMKIPYFAKGKAESLDKALNTGRFAEGLDKALFYFATDTKQWVLVDTDKTIYVINSYDDTPGPGGDGSVERVDQLPPILEAKTNVLYVVGKTVYSCDGSAFYPTYQEAIGALPSNVTVVEYVDDALNRAKQYTDEVKGQTLDEARVYADDAATDCLAQAKEYTDAVNALHIVQGGGNDDEHDLLSN